MLLETLDIKKDDVIIYSQNLFDMEKNFKIIYKEDPKKESLKISFSDVCRFVNIYAPKNLIVYRLLTNIKDFEIDLSKYGTFININNETELMYFDPIFAIKELEDYAKTMNTFDLRFRIQQVGLTTLNRKGELPNYAEIYSVDLESTEAKFQNDKIFADAILSLSKLPEKEDTCEKEIKADPSPKAGKTKVQFQPTTRMSRVQKIEGEKKFDLHEEKIEEVNPIPKIKIDDPHKDGIKLISHDISEDKDFNMKEIMKVSFKKSQPFVQEKKESKPQPQIVKEPSAKAKSNSINGKSAFGKFLQKGSNIAKHSSAVTQSSKEAENGLMNIFKSSASLNKFLEERENKTVVLKLNKK